MQAYIRTRYKLQTSTWWKETSHKLLRAAPSHHSSLSFIIPIFSNYKRLYTFSWWSPVSNLPTTAWVLSRSSHPHEHAAKPAALLGSGSDIGMAEEALGCAWSQGGLKTSPAHTATSGMQVPTFWHRGLLNAVVPNHSSSIWRMFSALGLAEKFCKTKNPFSCSTPNRPFLCQWGSTPHPDSNEQLASACVLTTRTYDKDNLSLVKVSSRRQLKSC